MGRKCRSSQLGFYAEGALLITSPERMFREPNTQSLGCGVWSLHLVGGIAAGGQEQGRGSESVGRG